MKNKYKLLLMLLCFALIFSMSFVSCREEPEAPETPEDPETPQEEETPPSAEDEEKTDEEFYATHVYWSRDIYSVSVRYVERSHWNWVYPMYDRIGGDTILGCWTRWSPDMQPPEDLGLEYAEIDFPIEAGDKILICEPRFVSNLNVSAAVYDFLESRDASEREFLIQVWENVSNEFRSTVSERDAALSDLCAQYMPEAQVLEKVGFASFQGTGTELLEMAEAYGKNVYVMFPEEFDDICGATVEQAQALVESGDFDLWCKVLKGSPLYGMTHEEIAAYLAQQESEAE